MTRLKLLLSLGLLTNSLLGQNLNYLDYITNDEELFSKVDSNYFYFLKELKIKSLTETKFQFDTLQNILDSSIVNYFSFDSLGRIVEHRYDYRYQSTKYRSVSYKYSMDGEIDQTFYDPFGRDYVLDGIYVSGKWPMYCEYRNSSYQIESIDIKTRLEGETYSMHYFYDQELFVKHYYYKEYLISGLDFLAGNRLECRHRITYVR
jgi:hypothetical protein